MSLTYVIDGYNITNHPAFSRSLPPGNRGDHRIALLDLIRINKLTGSNKNRVVVVFDGHPDQNSEGLGAGRLGIEVIFSRQKTADERIMKIVQESSNPKVLVVVSDDKEIRYFAKANRAKVMGVEEFVVLKKKFCPGVQVMDESKLSLSRMCEINKELRKRWLK